MVVPEAILRHAPADVALAAGLADEPARRGINGVPARGVQQLHAVIDMKPGPAGMRRPIAQMAVQRQDERAAHGVGLRAIDHEGANDLGIDSPRRPDAQGPVLAAEIDLLPIPRQGGNESLGPLGEVRREQRIILQHQQHAAALAQSIHERLFQDAEVREHAAPGPAALPPPGRGPAAAAVDGGEAHDVGQRTVAEKLLPPVRATVEVDAQRPDRRAAG